MAFPVLETTSTYASTSASTSHSVSLPSGINAGDLLLLQCNGTALLSGTPSGWTTFITGTTNIFYRFADGSEGSTVSLTFAAAQSVAAAVMRVSGVDTAPEGSTATGTATQPDGPNLAPSWGSADVMWVSLNTWAETATDHTVNTYPSGYTNTLETAVTSAGNRRVALATKNATASSENPGAYSMNGALGGGFNWRVNTVGLRGHQVLTPSLYTDGDTYFSPTVGRGAVSLTPSLYSDTDSFFSATVSFKIFPSLFSDGDTFNTHVIGVEQFLTAPYLAKHAYVALVRQL